MGRLSRLPIRVRLTAAFALAMVIVLATAALFVYFQQRSDLTNAVDNGLESRSNDVTALISGSDADLEEVRGSRIESTETHFVQVLSPDGRRLDRTGGSTGPALSGPDLARAATGELTLERTVPGIEGTARMLSRPVHTRGRTFIVVTGSSLDERNDTLSSLLKSFLIGGPIAVLLASGLGYLLASAALAPVEAMRRRAAQVSFERGGDRLPLPPAEDEIRRLGETLNEMLERLEESFQRERRFVADASHELRTPLAVLKAELEALIRNAGDDPVVRASILSSLEETDHLAQLAEDLLLIARASDGRLTMQREEVEVREVLQRTRQRFMDRAHQHGREIDVEAAEDLTVSVDPLRVRQALGNLVDNAIRHGSGKITLCARVAGDAVEVDVQDEGPGFTPAFAERAFERFARDDAARSRTGVGLGLSIVRVIAEAHGGAAVILDGDGSTVRLRFPLSATDPDPDGATQVPLSAAS
jgi:two-component system, OmpR family, sensor kinase